MTATRFKKWSLFALQVVVSVALLLWIFREPSFRTDIRIVFENAHPGWMAAAFVIAGAGAILGFVRWGIFLHVVGIRVSSYDVFRMGAVGLFCNSFLPGAVGGDAVKIGWLGVRGHPAKDGLLSVVMDRISGLGALIVCSGVFIGLRFDWLMESRTVSAMILFVALYLVVVTTLLVLSFVASAKGIVGRLPSRWPARKVFVEFAETYSLFVSSWPASLAACSISVAMLLAHFLTFYFAALSLGAPLPVLNFMAFMPAVDVIAALPVSLGGFGIREGVFSAVLTELTSVNSATAVGISFAGAFLTLIWGCLGLILLPGFQNLPAQDVQ